MKDNIKNNIISVMGLTYQYGINRAYVLKDIDFQASRGEIVAVTGLSGCGKSTFCLCLCGAELMNPDGIQTGKILINGKDIRKSTAAERALEVGIVFQNIENQLFSFTVEDEIAFAPENLCLPPGIIRWRVNGLLELLGIESLRTAHPHRLSGGEKSLVALAAVLALDPPVLIMDEVMSQLDAKGKDRVADALKRLRDMGKTIIVVEHDLNGIAFADRFLVLEDGKLKNYENCREGNKNSDWKEKPCHT